MHPAVGVGRHAAERARVLDPGQVQRDVGVADRGASSTSWRQVDPGQHVAVEDQHVVASAAGPATLRIPPPVPSGSVSVTYSSSSPSADPSPKWSANTSARYEVASTTRSIAGRLDPAKQVGEERHPGRRQHRLGRAQRQRPQPGALAADQHDRVDDPPPAVECPPVRRVAAVSGSCAGRPGPGGDAPATRRASAARAARPSRSTQPHRQPAPVPGTAGTGSARRWRGGRRPSAAGPGRWTRRPRGATTADGTYTFCQPARPSRSHRSTSSKYMKYAGSKPPTASNAARRSSMQDPDSQPAGPLDRRPAAPAGTPRSTGSTATTSRHSACPMPRPSEGSCAGRRVERAVRGQDRRPERAGPRPAPRGVQQLSSAPGSQRRSGLATTTQSPPAPAARRRWRPRRSRGCRRSAAADVRAVAAARSGAPSVEPLSASTTSTGRVVAFSSVSRNASRCRRASR